MVIYLDDIEIESVPNELKDFEVVLINDGSVSIAENIFREKTDIKFTFFGDAYEYLRNKEFCDSVKVKVKDSCGGSIIFEGTINVNVVRWLPMKAICNVEVYDTGYSAMIREKQENVILLNVEAPILQPLELSMFVNLGTYIYVTRAWDVLDVFKYVVNYLTRGEITVHSTYLANNKIALTTKGNIYYSDLFWNTSTTAFRFAEVSFQQLFSEIYKKERLKMWLVGTVLYIEQENSLNDNSLVYEIIDMPPDVEVSTNSEDIWSEIKIGSLETEWATLDIGDKKRIETWSEETYNNCACSLENTLDLVSEWVISSNVIYDLLLQQYDISDSFKDIVLIEYEVVGSDFKAKRTLSNSNYFYNKGLQNYDVMVKWFGGLPKCIADIFNEPCFEGSDDQSIILQTFESGVDGDWFPYLLPLKLECDTLGGGLLDITPECISPLRIGVIPPLDLVQFRPEVGTLYQVQFSGTYRFSLTATIENILNVNSSINNLQDKYRWHLQIFKADEIADVQSAVNIGLPLSEDSVFLENFISNFQDPFTDTLTTDTGAIALSAGECILPVLTILVRDIGGNWTLRDTVRMTEVAFKIESIDIDVSYSVATDLYKEYLVTVDNKVCLEDYNDIKSNPFGNIKVGEVNGKLKQLKYIHGQISEFTIKTKSKDLI